MHTRKRGKNRLGAFLVSISATPLPSTPERKPCILCLLRFPKTHFLLTTFGLVFRLTLSPRLFFFLISLLFQLELARTLTFRPVLALLFSALSISFLGLALCLAPFTHLLLLLDLSLATLGSRLSFDFLTRSFLLIALLLLGLAFLPLKS